MSIVENAGVTGRSFSLAERTAISATLPLLAHTAKVPNHRVWGKVFGFKNDFIVVQCLGTNVLETPRSYFSVDGGLTFSVLDTPSPSKLGHCALIKGQYMGDPAYEYRVVDPVTGLTISLKESERLGWFVLQHDADCRVAPRGALLFNEDGSVRTNATFEGLDNVEAVYLNQYIHVRAPRRNSTKLEEEGTYVSADAFDPLVDDVPQGLWNIKFDGMGGLVIGTNAKYPGSAFFHRPETPLFGSVYMGDGSVNGDMAFTL
ncbi:Hypothetical protein, putative [Bodo saltans]|uniref:Radial spoke head protein 9 homolog n=1 Tax=Bodo saltans TaxID=75058 RepID=A0A0S4IRW1_BODSA|nr:Hypothetical protein, putative [Bodo saltans]|eukprot:CUG04150.1 Hypothetical protein, putative [Bodo saltans]